MKTKQYFWLFLLMSAILIIGVFLGGRQIIYAADEADTTATDTAAAAETPAPAPDNAAAIDELNRQIKEQQDKIGQLNAEISKYNDNIKKARGETSNLKNQVYIIENQIAKTALDIQTRQEEVKTTELEIEKLQAEIKANEAAMAKNKTQLAAFIRQLDRYDNKTYLAILLANTSFSEFFDQIKNLSDVQGDLQKTLNRVQEIVAQLNSQKQEADKKRAQLQELLNKLKGKQAVLSDQKESKNLLISETKQSEKQFASLVQQLKKEQNAANAQMALAERKLRAELDKKDAGNKLNELSDAQLIWPINGALRLTTYFHDPDYPFRNLFEHSGLDLAVSMGTPIKAAESGYIAKAATGTQWYGNYIMIIHSNNLSTLYGHLSSLNVSLDQFVTKGQIIGYSGSTGFSTGPHLHFEVRSGGIPVDPKGYLP